MNSIRLTAAASFVPKSLEPPDAWAGHLPFAAWVMQELAPGIFVELGTHSGNSYFAFCQAAAEAGISAKCHAVDTWHGDIHTGRYDEDIFTQVNAHNLQHYGGFSRLLRMTFDDAVSSFADASIELLHIDGLHTYEAVKHDFETWLPKLVPGAVVMFHDTNVRERDFGVWKFWEELQARCPNNLEFAHSHGLGVLQLNNAPGEKKLAWLQPGSPRKRQLIDYFAALGLRQLERFELTGLKSRGADPSEAVAERDRHIASLNLAVAARNGQIASLNQALGERDRLVASLSQVREALLASNSWRVTAPLRSLGQLLRRIRLIVPTLHAVLTIGGGVLATLHKAGRVARKEGWRGVKRRILFAAGHDEAALDYTEWIRRYDTLTDAGRAVISRRIAEMQWRPLLSVIMPVYNPPIDLLDQAIWSVRNQLYPHWELCIADDASPNAEVHALLRRHAAADARIKIVFRTVNGHISRASNSAIEVATGEFLALLDHDDLLAGHALFWVAETINVQPAAGLIYSDEDKIDIAGKRSVPYFKCDWNPDLLLSQNLISHLGVYRAELVRQVGGFREGFEGSQDYDLALRCVERLRKDQVIHIPRVLYFWRVIAGSTALTVDAKPYAVKAGERAINEHLARTGRKGTASLTGLGYRVRFEVPSPPPRVSIVIPTRNAPALIRECVSRILGQTDYPSYEILIVDNRSDDPEVLAYFESLKSNGRVRILRDDRPFNFSALCNLAVGKTDANIIGLVNNDTKVITPEWLTEMVSLAMQPGVGAVGARLWYPDDTLQHAGVILGIGGVAGHSHNGLPRTDPGYFGRAALLQTISAVTAACLVIRREIYLEVGGMDEDNLHVAFNDVDFCLKVRELGYRNVWTPYAEMYHHESATRGYEDNPIKRQRFEREVEYMQQRWRGVLENDPAYSPNLTLDRENFSIAWPPRVEVLG